MEPYIPALAYTSRETLYTTHKVLVHATLGSLFRSCGVSFGANMGYGAKHVPRKTRQNRDLCLKFSTIMIYSLNGSVHACLGVHIKRDAVYCKVLVHTTLVHLFQQLLRCCHHRKRQIVAFSSRVRTRHQQRAVHIPACCTLMFECSSSSIGASTSSGRCQGSPMHQWSTTRYP